MRADSESMTPDTTNLIGYIRRPIASLIDIVVSLVLYMPIYLFVISKDMLLYSFWIPAFFIVGFAYTLACWLFWNGSTLGERVAGYRIIPLNNNSALPLVLRAALPFLFYLATFALMYFSIYADGINTEGAQLLYALGTSVAQEVFLFFIPIPLILSIAPRRRSLLDRISVTLAVKRTPTA